MTVRETLGLRVDDVHERLDQVLDSEDGIIVLMDRTWVTSFCHGFGASGCQLELLCHQIDSALRALIHGTGSGPSRLTTSESKAEC